MATNAQGLNSLATIIKRLEAATSRLEDMHSPKTRLLIAPAPPAPPVEDSQSVKAFDELVITGKLEPFLKVAGEIGGPVKEQSDIVGNLFQNLRGLIQCAAASAKPSDATFMSMLGPLQSQITAVNSVKDKYRKERELGNHFSTLSEGVPAVGWVTVSPKPAPYVGDMRDSATFYANRVLKDFKDKDQKHAEWARGFLALLDELKKYGGDAAQFKSASAPAAGGAPPPPPPPPPPAGVPPPPPPATSAPAPAVPDTSAVFAQINQGADITKGLRKVNKDEMTHKNPALRASGTVPTTSGAGARRPSKPAKPAALQTKKPPKMELSGNKWSIVGAFDPSTADLLTLIKGKVNGVVLFNCKKTSVLIESLVAGLSITSSPSFTVQITGVSPTIQIDNSDSGQIYLSKECLGVEIITAKCSAINQDAYYSQHPQMGSDGRYLGVETVSPLNEPWVGGFQAQGQMPHAQVQGNVPIPPYHSQSGFPEPGHRPPAWIPDVKIPGDTYTDHAHYPGPSPYSAPPLSAVERSNALGGPPRMDPHLQMMCGPLLRYDTVDDHGIWHGPNEMGVRYRLNMGQELEFFIPGQNQNMRWAAHSCNGFSAGVNQDDFRGPGHATGYDPLWKDLLDKHAERPFHALVGGGDQLYCDAMMREPELQPYIALKTPKEKVSAPLTDDVAFAIDRHYCLEFRRGMFSKANSSIPMVNMLDDHDLIDGFGSYPDDLQLSPIFRHIGSRGYFFYLLFQCFTVAGWMVSTQSLEPIHSNQQSSEETMRMLLLDCRAERKKELVCSQITYDRIFWHLHQLPQQVEHVIIQLGIPIAYPRMNFLETALESKLNPFTALAQKGSLGLSGFVNKFNKDPELLDDLNDHWTAKSHKRERNWFVEQVQALAKAKRIRVTFLSGDVHCAAVGYFKTLVRGGGKGHALDPLADHRYMLNVVTSAIVNTPPPVGVLTMVGMLADRPHKTMHYCDTDESMIPLFRTDTDGTPLKQPYIMGRRNYTSVELDDQTGNLNFDIRIERVKGSGDTVSYPVIAPPPRWV
ncbi:adenylyl cyclase-associated protein 1 [Rhizoctonia solani]|uniref:Adenylyl cyclase-associated protein n=1 Tax=Rhizoctonia solani TaxID=456999 RepID=A0A8H8PCF9_9AGAM|nr:adenylyl cyclase-associated protein 1 [Rhizoctonia solani]QRW27563.1 adenylyl cyclase-associated protein 1 [Rhizoctonia solani]